MSVGRGWIGPIEQLENYLAVVGADRDEEGKFLIVGAPVSSFMGMGQELVVPAETCYLVKGKPVPLAANMVAVMGQGKGRGMAVTVIA